MRDRYRELCDAIAAHARLCGRNPATITLVAVSKGHPWESVKPLYDAGCRDFGENRVTEGEAKIAEAPSDIQWHYIGTLQKNKVRKVIGKYALIHAVDTPELARKISDCSVEAGVCTRILLQVNTSGEATKHGLTPEEWQLHLAEVGSLPGIEVRGLMTMAPLTEDEATIRACFAALRRLRDAWGLTELSMGMSHDWKIAVEEGGTLLRVGTLLFQDMD